MSYMIGEKTSIVETINFIKQVRIAANEQVGVDEKVYMVLDNASAHRSK